MKLSVLMITYNHENYIVEALNSVLRQQVDFEYEIVIGDDCSTDQTRNVLLEYENKYPEKIRLILHEKNIGMHANLESVFNGCLGEYIAVLEGDDYWVGTDKLQKQVNFMEANKDISESFHKVTTIYQNGDKESHEFPLGLTEIYFSLKDVVSQFFIPTLSIMFRKSVIEKFPMIFYQLANPDWLIHILCAEKGKVGFINEVMGVYRVHSGGVWSGLTRVNVLENTIRSAKIINKYLNFQYDSQLKRQMLGCHLEAGIILMKNLTYIQSAKHFFNVAYLGIFLILRKLNDLGKNL
jgi:glycosyltransferase involved in cell wall biosynthesis